jgi:hypothetical protein
LQLAGGGCAQLLPTRWCVCWSVEQQRFGEVDIGVRLHLLVVCGGREQQARRRMHERRRHALDRALVI